MTPTTAVVLVPIAVPVGTGNGGWQNRSDATYAISM
jgi:hypothetical protein